MNAFDTLFSHKSVKSTISVKNESTGRTDTTTLTTVPADLTREAFEEAADNGINAGRSLKEDDGRTIAQKRKGVTGLEARNAVRAMFGLTPIVTEAPAPVVAPEAPVSIPPTIGGVPVKASKPRGRKADALVPSNNAEAPADGATAS